MSDVKDIWDQLPILPDPEYISQMDLLQLIKRLHVLLIKHYSWPVNIDQLAWNCLNLIQKDLWLTNFDTLVSWNVSTCMVWFKFIAPYSQPGVVQVSYIYNLQPCSGHRLM